VSYSILTPYGVESVAPGAPVIASISAGHREVGKDGRAGPPQRSKDGEIYLHVPSRRRLDAATGEVVEQSGAPGLQAALERNAYRWLRVAFPSNRLEDVFHQSLRRYSATRLEVFGDAERLTEILQNGERRVVEAGTPEYRKLAQTCKGNYSILFVLAEYVEDGVRLLMPDGLGYYRIRTTSRNSVRRFLEMWECLRRYTGGRPAGVPVDISVQLEEVVTPDGTRRRVPVWQFEMRTPDGSPLTSRVLPSITRQAIAESERLSLPAPELPADDEDADIEPQDDDVVDDVELARSCDAEFYRRAWFSAVAGTPWESDDARHQWIRDYTGGQYESLSAFLQSATEAVATEMLNAIREQVASWRDTQERADLIRALKAALEERGITGAAARRWLADNFGDVSRVAALSSEQLRAAIELTKEVPIASQQ